MNQLGSALSTPLSPTTDRDMSNQPLTGGRDEDDESLTDVFHSHPDSANNHADIELEDVHVDQPSDSTTSILPNSDTQSSDKTPKTWRERLGRKAVVYPGCCLLLIFICIIVLMTSPSYYSNDDGVCTLGVASATYVTGTPATIPAVTPPETLIAYIGDVALARDHTDTPDLYAMMAKENPDAIVIQGDLDYDTCPLAFDAQISQYFGDAFPVFTVAGNHDIYDGYWNDYSNVIAKRWQRANITTCLGDAGRQHVCTFRGITFAQVSPGLFNFNATYSNSTIASYIDQVLTTYPSRWLVCSWHLNMARMQTGSKNDDTGWGVYETCRQRGAFIATGHEHSYARTLLLSDFRNQIVNSTNSTYLPITPGNSVAFCNGLGGRSTRNDTECTTQTPCPWFASTINHSNHPEVKAAALFCRYYVRGNPNLADCQLKDASGNVWDSFTLDVSGMPLAVK